MASKFGVFSEPGYLSPGITYRKQGKAEKITDFTPPNIKATLSRRGKGNDATFDRFKPLFEKEPYASRPKKEKQRGENPWKAPSPMKQSSGLGGFYGTLGGHVQYVAQGETTSKAKPEPPVRSIYTCPAKKGSYGTARTTLSQISHPFGVVSEYAYKGDPYRSGHEILAAEGKAERQKRLTEMPFKPAGSSRCGRYGNGVYGEYAYHPEGVNKSQEKKTAMPEVPFKPGGMPKQSLVRMIGRFPEFIPNGPGPNLRQQRATETSGNPWRPSSFGKTDCTRSIIRMNT